MIPEVFTCISSISQETRGFKNYFSLIGFSGKGLSDLGLEEECLRNRYIYYLLTYNYNDSSNVTLTDQKNTFIFFQQKTFFTGLCLTRECNKILNFIFNETLDKPFYDYIYENLNIQNAKIYDIGKIDNSSSKINPYDTYDEDGSYNHEKTLREKKKFDQYFILKLISNIYLVILLLTSVFIHIFYRPCIKTKELKNEIEEDSSNYEPEEENNENKPIFSLENKIIVQI